MGPAKKSSITFILVLTCTVLIQCRNSTSTDGGKQQDAADSTGTPVTLRSENDLMALATKICGDATSGTEKARRIIDWSNSYLDWNESDYVERSVIEIINQKGGTCGEQSMTVRALLDLAGVRNRECAEINIQPESEQREADSKELIETYGLRMSVFGLRHNDHRWVEYFDEEQNEWIPTDPTLRLFGMENWIKSRIGFNDRPAHEIINSRDMIVPVTILAMDENGKIAGNLSEHYLVDQFNKVYNYELQNLPSWQDWKERVQDISPKCESAFKGELNLHEYNDEILEILLTYNRLKEEYNSK